MKTLITILAITLSITASAAPSIEEEFGPGIAALIDPLSPPVPTAQMFPPRPGPAGEGDLLRLSIVQNHAAILGTNYLFLFWSQVGTWSVGVGTHPIYPDLSPPQRASTAAATKPAKAASKATKPATFRRPKQSR